MGELISLAERRKARKPRPRGHDRPVRAEFLFDLACPFTYLASERVERAFDDVVWTAASGTALRRGSLASDDGGQAAVRAAAKARAHVLRLPLVWPEKWPSDVPAAMRAASYAAESGRGAAFALAAGRLAFCGGAPSPRPAPGGRPPPPGSRRCASGARCSGARGRWPRRPPSPGSAPRLPAGAR